MGAHIRALGKRGGDYVFDGRGEGIQHLSTRQYARLVSDWVALDGLNPAVFRTYSLRRTKATVIYRRTGNLRVVSGATPPHGA